MESLVGVVVTLNRENKSGLIRPTDRLPHPFKHGDVSFAFRDTRGSVPDAGDTVDFILHQNSGSRPRAFVVKNPRADEHEDTKRETSLSKEVSDMEKRCKRDGKAMFHGTVVSITENGKWGTVESAEPDSNTKRLLFKRAKESGINIHLGDNVVFTLPSGIASRFPVIEAICKDSSASNPGSRECQICQGQKKQNTNTDPKEEASQAHGIYQGRVEALPKGTNIGYLKPMRPLPKGYRKKANVKFNIKETESLGLALAIGDTLEFTLGMKEKDKPRAFKLKLVRCTEREPSLIKAYIEKLKCMTIDPITDDESHKEKHYPVLKLLSCDAVWRCIGDCEEIHHNSVLNLMEVVNSICKNEKAVRLHLQRTLQELSTTKLFRSNGGRLSKFVKHLCTKDHARLREVLMRFCRNMVEHVPRTTRSIVRILKPLCSTDQWAFENFLYNIIQSVLPREEHMSDLEWNELPVIPPSNCLLGPALDASAALRSVKTSDAYASVEDYLDTYFRLLWTDCFTGLQKGIKHFLAGKLDLRDMNLYYAINLVGVQIGRGHNGLCLMIEFISCKLISNWKTSSCLTYGNLLCISPSGTFKDIIWATVADRSAETLEKKMVVGIELVDDLNSLTQASIILALANAGKGIIMAESPTYFEAYKPALTALQRLDLDHIPFVNTIVEVKESSRPTYHVTDVDRSSDELDRDPKETDMVSFNHEPNCEVCSDLDQSQVIAVEQALKQQVAMIQGPPGTGKTYVGVKILLHKVNYVKIDGPILVLTYKNHALDEFLKSLLPVFPSSVVRVGGRSSEQLLEECNLKELSKTTRKCSTLREEISELIKEESSLQDKIKQLTMNLVESSTFDPLILIQDLNGRQVFQLLNNFDIYKMPDNIHLVSIKLPAGKKSRYRAIKQWLQDNREWIESSAYQECPAENMNDLKTLVSTVCWQWLPSVKKLDEIVGKFQQRPSQLDDIIASEKKNKAKNEELEGVAEDTEYERVSASEINNNPALKCTLNLRTKADKGGTEWSLSAVSANMLEHCTAVVDLDCEDLWALSDEQRVYLITRLLHKRAEDQINELDDTIQLYSENCQLRKELQNQHKTSILRGKKVIGMTITGASIHTSLLELVKPQVVIVEEAAEVLEPHLLAILGAWVRHLVLIGDHKQLKPMVETYSLRKNFKFDTSMMERLINNSLPFATLKMQNRMRLEFAELLLDIYPDLHSNHERVEKNMPPSCIKESMFFWDHRSHEKSERGYTNEEEADRSVRLAQFLVLHGYRPEQVTILSAYLGQVQLIRKKMNLALKSNGNLNGSKETRQKSSNGEVKSSGVIAIRTIDSFQGDENDVIIVSLVRSNQKERIGFLKELNRRCVAQSRAKCGMYFIGNQNTLRGDVNWRRMLSAMSKKGCVGNCLTLQCYAHRDKSFVRVNSAAEVPLGTFCKEPCKIEMKCQTHKCPKPCQPYHIHSKCKAEVIFMFQKCKHTASRKCHQDQLDIVCQAPCNYLMECGKHQCMYKCGEEHSHVCNVKVKHTFRECGHVTQRPCHKDPRQLRCTLTCGQRMSCGIHTCLMPCYPKHSHSTCTGKIEFIRHSCKHTLTRICHEKESDIICEQKCRHKMPCGIHKCSKSCEPKHDHRICSEEVHETCSDCSRVSRRPCHKKAKKCVILHTFPICDHKKQVSCSADVRSLKCLLSCHRKLTCGHPCSGICGDPCRSDLCEICSERKMKEEQLRQKAEKSDKEAALKDVELEIKRLIQKRKPGYRKVLSEEGETASEYYGVIDRVTKYIQKAHDWFPVVTKIEKISNPTLRIKWLKAKRRMADPDRSELKFHGTSKDAVEAIVNEGFRLPSREGMFGKGIYFATDASKSAQEMYTKGSQMLLLCDVTLGKSMTVEKAENGMNLEKLKSLGFDSLYAKRNTRGKGGVRFDEFVVYDPAQALPKYLIHFRCSSMGASCDDTLTREALIKGRPVKYSLEPTRTVDQQDPKEYHFRMAESQFLRLRACGGYGSPSSRVTKVEYYVNPTVVRNFDNMEAEMKRKYGTAEEAKSIFTFHGTRPENIPKIMAQNFRLDKMERGKYGLGIYFSEFPSISVDYAHNCNQLLLCKVLPGRAYQTGATNARAPPSGYDSHIVMPDGEGKGQMNVIFNPDQILPCYVIYHT